jgi:uncharacterized protein YerC
MNLPTRMPPINSLRLSEADYRDACQRAEELRALRNELVLAAVRAGYTHAQIANATGLTRARIGQIALIR